MTDDLFPAFRRRPSSDLRVRFGLLVLPVEALVTRPGASDATSPSVVAHVVPATPSRRLLRRPMGRPNRSAMFPILVDETGAAFQQNLGTGGGFRPLTTIGGAPSGVGTHFGGIVVNPTVGPARPARNGPFGGPAIGPQGQGLFDRRRGAGGASWSPSAM